MPSDEVRDVIAGLRDGDEVEADYEPHGGYTIRGIAERSVRGALFVGPLCLDFATAVRVIKRAPLPEPHLHYCDCADCTFADQVSKAVHLLKAISLDITYTDEGLEVIARQIIRVGVRQALEAVQGMRGLTLDGPRMQVHAEERIKMLLAVPAATPGGDDE